MEHVAGRARQAVEDEASAQEPQPTEAVDEGAGERCADRDRNRGRGEDELAQELRVRRAAERGRNPWQRRRHGGRRHHREAGDEEQRGLAAEAVGHQGRLRMEARRIPCGDAAYGRSNNSTSASCPRSSTISGTSVAFSASPATSGWPPAITLPRATCA